jgi:enoyl-CoA hydratase
MTTEATDVVLQERRGNVLIITLNRPAEKNAVDYEVATRLAAAIDLLDADPEISVGVLTGAGGTFSAGMDLKAFARGQAPILPGRGFGGLTRATVRKPLIAAVEGWALGGGFEMVLACDLIVAADDARFGSPEVKWGLAPLEGDWCGCRTAFRTTSPPSSC